jgi:hypothetical protein
MSSSSGNGMITLICVGGFIVVVCFFLLLSAFQARKRKNGFTAAIGQLGFAAQTQPDPELAAGLQRLFEPAKVNSLKNVAVKLMGDENYYLFDITYTSPQYSNHSSSSVNTEFNNVAILSPHLDLPPFILLNRMKIPGALAGLADSVLIYGAASAGFSEYKQVPPVFQMNYMLFVKDDPRVATAFTDELLNRIGLLDNIVGRGEDRLLMLNRFDFRASSKLDVNKLSDQVNLLRQFTDWLVK